MPKNFAARQSSWVSVFFSHKKKLHEDRSFVNNICCVFWPANPCFCMHSRDRNATKTLVFVHFRCFHAMFKGCSKRKKINKNTNCHGILTTQTHAKACVCCSKYTTNIYSYQSCYSIFSGNLNYVLVCNLKLGSQACIVEDIFFQNLRFKTQS